MPENKPEIHDGILNMTPEETLINNSDDNIYRVLFSEAMDPFDTSYNYTRDPLFNKPFPPYRNPPVKKKNPHKAKQAAQRQARKIMRVFK